MRNYKLLVTLPGTLSETELEPKLKEIKEVLEDTGAEELNMRDLGKTKMSYEMDGIKYGYYYLYEYEMEPDKTSELDQKLSKVSNVLRAIVDRIKPAIKEKRKDVDEVRALQGREEILDLIEEKYSEEDQQEQKQETKNKSKKKESKEKEQKTEKPKKKEETEEEDEVSMEDIDEKLDEILEDEDLSDI